MKWENVEITDVENKVHRGKDAKRFVAVNCQPLPIRTSEDDVIIVNTRASQGTTDNKEVRRFLFSNLLGKAKSVKFFKGEEFQRESLPLARALLNVVNSNPAKLKVRFIYKQDPKDTSEPILLKDSKITVKALREGLSDPLTAVYDNGVADFGKVFPGKYTITPDYPKSDECKYDWIDASREVLLEPAEEEIVVFEVEPLYQQVQFIAHCLLTIPDQVFEESPNDSDKVEVTRADGKRTFKFKQKPVELGRFNKGELDPPLPAGVEITYTDEEEGEGKLTLGKKISYWKYEDLDKSKGVLRNLEFGKPSSPTNYKVKLKENVTLIELKKDPLKTAQYSLDLGPQPDAKNAEFDLRLMEIKTYWTFAELNEKEKQAIHFDKLEIKEPRPDAPNIYDVRFKEPLNLPKPMPGRKPSGEKATLRGDLFDKSKGILTLNEKDVYWQLNDLDKKTLDPVKIEVGQPNPISPNVYPVTFNKKGEFYSEKDLEGKWKAKYHGYLKDLDDIDARVKFVKETIEKAREKSSQEPTVLKVFMIPECYFQGLFGAYLTDDAAELVERLQKLVAEEKWKDWVFSFGTINRVFLGLQPQIVTKEQKIYEMANHALVIRGGLGEARFSGETSTRLIQKLVNSAELADATTLILDPQVEEMRIRKDKDYRPQAVNENVQFEATENDNKVANLLVELLKADIKDSFGLPGTLWNDLKEEIKAIIKELGIARVVRQIRTSENEDVNDKDLKDWAFSAIDPKKKVVKILYRTQKTCLPTLDQAALQVIKRLWNKLFAAQFNNSVWESDAVKRKNLLEQDSGVFKNAAKECGFQLPYQQEEISKQLTTLKTDDSAAKKLVMATKDSPFEPTVFPIWRKLLEIYAQRTGKTMPFEFVQSGMKLEDYCFAGPRKAGPWFAKLEDAKKVIACKRMVFGLEICADHPTKRLFALNQGSNEKTEPFIGIDIHLLPSAGMSPNYYGARKGGFIFNCDGWNKAHPDGGKSIKVYFDGPRPVVEGEEITTSPVYPHSALGIRAGDSMEVPTCLEPTWEELDTKLSDVIFAKGPGELHFYPIQDLPK